MAEKDKTDSIRPLTTRLASSSNIIFAAGVVAILATLLIPLPTFLLDVALSCSISLAIAVLVIVMGSNNALDLSTFPSLLLITTLFRLSLNVASTRLILLQGNAGTIINTFGNFVAGGNIVVGLVMFIILVVIQFIVVTKGATRISEVAARFVLDAMPGKQMAIDADLNAGNITDTEAKKRRDDIVKESEFYGAMDGACKFISGDAKAGLIITAVNLVGGITLGYIRGMTLQNAMRQYSILSIGDGLVSQIPSVIIAVSSGFLVSKIRSENTVSYDMTNQMLRRAQPIGIAAAVIGAFAFVPGFPKMPFFTIASVCAYFAYSAKKTGGDRAPVEKAQAKEKDETQSIEELLSADILSILVGVRLISLVDPRKKSGVLERIGALRRKFAQQMGLVIPLVRLRDNINLQPNAYEIRLYDHIIASGNIEPDKFLAMDSGAVEKPIKGLATKEPVYGLPALWISDGEKTKAEMRGYTVIDPESVLIAHLSETLSRHAHELLTREDVQQLVDRLRKVQPSLVGEVIGEHVSVGLLQQILQNLLREGISIRDLSLILEAVGANSSKTKNAVLLTELARKALVRTITEKYQDSKGKISVITLDPELEHQLVSRLSQQGENIMLAIPPEVAMELNKKIAYSWKNTMDAGCESVVLLCDARLRPALSAMVQRTMMRLPVIAYDEILSGTNTEPVETISLTETAHFLSEHSEPLAVS